MSTGTVEVERTDGEYAACRDCGWWVADSAGPTEDRSTAGTLLADGEEHRRETGHEVTVRWAASQVTYLLDGPA
jgi:hypothetical protein